MRHPPSPAGLCLDWCTVAAHSPVTPGSCILLPSPISSVPALTWALDSSSSSSAAQRRCPPTSLAASAAAVHGSGGGHASSPRLDIYQPRRPRQLPPGQQQHLSPQRRAAECCRKRERRPPYPSRSCIRVSTPKNKKLSFTSFLALLSVLLARSLLGDPLSPHCSPQLMHICPAKLQLARRPLAPAPAHSLPSSLILLCALYPLTSPCLFALALGLCSAPRPSLPSSLLRRHTPHVDVLESPLTACTRQEPTQKTTCFILLSPF